MSEDTPEGTPKDQPKESKTQPKDQPKDPKETPKEKSKESEGIPKEKSKESEGIPKESKGWSEERRKKQAENMKKIIAEGKAGKKATPGEIIPEDEESQDGSHFTYYLSCGLIVLLGLIGAGIYLIKTGTIKIQPKE